MVLTHDSQLGHQNPYLSHRLPIEEHINVVFWFNIVQPMMGC